MLLVLFILLVIFIQVSIPVVILYRYIERLYHNNRTLTTIFSIKERNEVQLLTGVTYFTGTAWKHHIAEHFESGQIPLLPSTCAGINSTIFTDYDLMIDYLRADGRRWYVAELQLVNHPLYFDFGNDFMATTPVSIKSVTGFVPIDIS